ncbi:NAD(P)-dependent alcohol dehydrogenase [Rhodococcus sp. NPDC056960]|uniref:NAD(P)-dependent alcohol dehydrogenase n=1 Tax=Rhodococcus sp. NPDC056960 TaxID=3345982 RepID=UPI00363531F7
MKVARLLTPGADFVIEELPRPQPGPGEVLIKIAGAGVCHSDLHIKQGGVPGVRLPNTLGHENAGWIEEFGPGTESRGFEIGDPVVVFGGWGCGTCRFCLGGQEQLCNTSLWSGVGPPGGYAEFLIVPSVRVLVPTGDVDPVLAATLTDAALTPYSAVKKTLPRLVPGTSVLSIGVGGLGQYGIQFLKMLTPARVIAIDTDPAKRELASTLGADVVLDPGADDATDQIMELTRGQGAEAVIDFVGVNSTMTLGTLSVGKQGLFVLVGLAGGSVPYSFFGIAQGASLTTSNWGTRNELTEVLALAQRGALVSHIEKYPLTAINDVFNRLERGMITGRAVLVP